MKKFAIHTLGCKINQYESTLIAENLKRQGLTLVDFKDTADFYIINTCTVTAEADRKSRQMVRQAKKRNPNSTVIVTGCYSNLNPEVFKNFTVIKDKMDVVKFITGFPIEDEIIKNSFDKSRFFIKIQDGCNKFCTYCRIPYARGMEIRSKPVSIVLKEIELAIENSYPEIVLAGINIGLYGKDFGKTFLDLLNAIDKNNYNVRFRISSIDPKDAYNILDFLSVSKNFAHHLHISLQSGSDRILKLMNRGYTKKFFVNLLKGLRDIDPLYSVSTDIIVGFPTENDDSVSDTLDVIKNFEFSRIHIFPYSNRPETLAFKMKGQLDKPLIKRYLSKVHDAAALSKDNYKRLLNGNEDYGVYEGKNKLLGQYYVDAIDLKRSEISRNFIYEYENEVLYAL